MGQQQNANTGTESKEGKDHIHQPLKNRYGASFKEKSRNVVNPNATGEGAASGKNPGKPT